jgi:hypothetical protein
MRRGLLLAGASVVALGIAAGSAGAVIGGPPTLDIPRCDRFTRPCGDPIILGEGQHHDRRVEVIGFSARGGPCVGVDTIIPRFGGLGFYGCGGWETPDEAIDPSGYLVDAARKGGHYATQVDALLRPDVARVEARYPRNGSHRTKEATVAQIAGPLQDHIEAPEPFGIAVISVRGCIPGPQIHLTAYDSNGATLGAANLGRGFNFCQGRTLPRNDKAYRSTSGAHTKVFEVDP